MIYEKVLVGKYKYYYFIDSKGIFGRDVVDDLSFFDCVIKEDNF